MAAKRKPPIKPSETFAVRIARLSQIQNWRLEVPFYARDAQKRITKEIEKNHYPPLGVSSYTFDQAVKLLAIFCNRYTGNGQYPPVDMEPVAFEIVPPQECSSDRKPTRFTFKDVSEDAAKLAVPAVREQQTDDEDEAARWLRENGGDPATQ